MLLVQLVLLELLPTAAQMGEAAKARWVDELGSALIAARLEPKQGEPAVLALVRAFRYNYADAPEGALDLAVEVGDSVMSHRRRFSLSTSRACGMVTAMNRIATVVTADRLK